jgi:hypothetical protein
MLINMKRLKIVIPIASAQKGFLVSLARELENRGHETFFIAWDNNVLNLIQRLFPEKPLDHIDVRQSYLPEKYEDIIAEFREREKSYGVTFSLLASQDRALGKGYLFNADSHPNVARAWWPKEEKYKELLHDLQYCEHVLAKFSPDLIVGFGQWKTLAVVCHGKSIPYLTMSTPRYKSRYIWVENRFEQNCKLLSAIRRHVETLTTNPSFGEVTLEQSHFAQYFFRQMQYTYWSALRELLDITVKETYRKLRGTFKKNSYHYLGWTRYILQRPYVYKYFLRHGKTIEDLKGSRIILYPLQVEPESSLLDLSPELNNSMELIAWISKSLPADATLVVKEHPAGFGPRSTRYFDNFRRMTNVVLAHPAIPSIEWLKHCSLVAVMTGTMGFEAVYMNKPVISFGKYNPINELPTVRYADSFDTTRAALDDLLGLTPEDFRFNIAREALHRALEEITFDLGGLEKLFKTQELHMDLARAAVDNLMTIYPEPFC